MRKVSRRMFLGGLAAGAALPGLAAPAILRAQSRRLILDGVASGDLGIDSAVIWSRFDQAGRMLVEWSTTESFANAERVRGMDASAARDFTATTHLTGLPAGQTIFYRVSFEGNDRSSEPAVGRLRMPDSTRNGKVSFVFGGDQCGAGWGINPQWGGIRIYDTMLKTDPDLLIHLGDRIYADNVLSESVKLEDGSLWRNHVTPAKASAAQTLDDYRGNYRYNLMDENVRHFAANVPQFHTWDDHETINDWWPGKIISDSQMKRLRYRSPEVDRLAANARRAFYEYSPLSEETIRRGMIWRPISYGPMLDVFLLDQRSHRSANKIDGRYDMDNASTLMGRAQIDWLKSALAKSKAVWKVIASPLPLAHVSRANSEGDFDKFANGTGGQPVGREREAAEILSWIKANDIRNTLWIAADVHYAAANEFHPDRAAFKDFSPFWEFIAGPFHTQAFPPGRLDPTFGPQNRYASTHGVKGNQPPSAGWCNFGHAEIDAASGAMTVSFRNDRNQVMWLKTLSPERS
jgi:alkaline phosphatase D